MPENSCQDELKSCLLMVDSFSNRSQMYLVMFLLSTLLTFCFRGAGEDGQLGKGLMAKEDPNESLPTPIAALNKLSVCAVVAGSRNSLAICENGDVRAWDE